MAPLVTIHAAVEGDLDEAVVRRLIAHAGAEPGTVYGKAGKDALRAKVGGYNNAARRAPWLVLVDLDAEEDCAPPLCRRWLADPAPLLCFRVAVRQIEAWLMADRDTLGRYLRVARSRIPPAPETLSSPKDTLVSLARGSRSRNLRQDMVPREGSGRRVGPAYTSRMIEYVLDAWRPAVASTRAESLLRAIRCIERLAGAAA